ncbi:MAG: AmmeMemoRadiSam system radical SAM enzyme [Thermodesulfobacteriota bacterium]|nr:AmmeMemoRadiSam system radical SAM enzyme [Thermodesulfobacteriota bacterium]
MQHNTPFNRREFLKTGISGIAMVGAASCLPPAARALSLFGGNNPASSGSADIRGRIFENDAPATLWKWSREAFAYTTRSKDTTICGICPNSCILTPGNRGVCRSKVNINGKLYSLAYGNPCAVHLDPIEKKPLFHFRPASRAFSIAAAGCNFRCLNCQNWQISQRNPEALRHHDMFPEAVVASARQAGATAIAYTYSEPTTFFEYMYDTAMIARQHNLSNLWISNGYINHEPLLSLCKVLDAANVNLKSFSNALYKKLNGGTLQPVLDTFITLHQQNVHFEMTNLVVPGYTDDPAMFAEMCNWIHETLGPDHPLHLLRFHPQYKLRRLAPTPVAILTRFREIAMSAGIHYVYVGNVPGHEGENTFCHHCKKMIIQRNGYRMGDIHIKEGKCEFCDATIPGVWS